ncbi:MAG TPA: TnsA endonuclease C-terminal domain-containing protein [Pyrinomonadaceae bacterium]|nr:TnsA endonuclease C-terminal domain-containing protein [Pyrinomonadaceae bacterium]
MTGDEVPKLIAEGRGQGEGEDYQPWIKVQDFSSYGQANRDLDAATGRQHDYFSRLEFCYHLVLGWSGLLDIQEQFPLLPLETTISIANELGIRHPVDFKTKKPVVMTTDFRISVPLPVGKEVVFRTTKPAAKLLETRVIEKLELERRFYASLDANWGIVTERQIDPVLVNNLMWSYKFKNSSSLHPLPEEMIYRVSCLLTEGLLGREISLSGLALECDDLLGLNSGTSLSVARHLIASRQWQVDMMKIIDPRERLIFLGVNLLKPGMRKTGT